MPREKYVKKEVGIYEISGGAKRKKPFVWRQRIKGVPYYETFSSLKAAKAAKAAKLAEIRKYGEIAHTFREADWRELATAREALEGTGYTVERACREIASRFRHRAFSLAKHAQWFSDTLKSNGVGDRQVANIGHHLAPLVESFGGLRPSQVERGDLMRLIEEMKERGLSPRTILNFRNDWHSFFSYLVDEDALAEAPTKRIARRHLPKVRKSSQKNPLEVWQVVKIMAYMEERYPQWAFWMALQFFTGTRAGEAKRFRFEWIFPDRKVMVIPAWSKIEETGEMVQGAKTQDDWVIDEIPPNFWAWLEVYGKKSGKVESPNWSEFRNGMIRRGVIESWPHNCRRDTFCTCHLSGFRDPAKTALMLKHRRPDTLWQSYMGALMPRWEGRSLFALYPRFSLVGKRVF